jgi:VanZ family protein
VTNPSRADWPALFFGSQFWSAAAVLWTAAVLGLTVSSLGRLDWIVETLNDKLLHGVAFALGTWVWAMALRGIGKSALPAIFAGGFISFALGGMIEYLQHLVPGRSSDPADLVANTIGIIAVISLLLLKYRQHNPTSTINSSKR